tara:strand:+ start:137 stop:613 length:477 start_codon:yes stop_codon:yes gene_type:complete
MEIVTSLGAAALALLLQTQGSQPDFGVDQAAATQPCTDQYADSLNANSVSDEEWIAIISCVFTNTAAQMDAGLPEKIDEITSLVSVSSNGATFKYVYVLDVDVADVRQANIDSLKAATRNNACTSANMVQTMELGGSYFYRWVDRSGTLITTMLIEGC